MPRRPRRLLRRFRPACTQGARRRPRAIVDFTGRANAIAPLLKALVDAGVPVVAFGERRATLEQIFMKVAAFETA